jgi:DNA-binding protein YbaB
MAGPGAPNPFSYRVMVALEADDIQMAARALQDSMWIDDSWPEDDEALEDMLTDAAAQTIEDVAAVGAEWLTQFRQGGWHEAG